ncbi:phosphoribosylanthranilate isomerase [Gemmobacter aquaticus]|jgi:putative membrane protein|uniref:Phosphoribosylanthranilate isomerase n=1 Tax=Gemmobacter aquaticus TaxID=490185 RepID=A0A918DCT4_9RHOB|nr:LapA family protein [Gemmobacter aquaticus]GGO28812.1 phosphoribosylanthranilate isomerase [Gemmobacter aquaticus]
MLKYLRYALLAVTALCLLTLAIANRAPVTLRALPDDIAAVVGMNWQINLPLFAVIFGGIAVGLLIGFVWEWLREHRYRSEAGTKAAEARRLQRELAAMRDAKGEVQDDVLAILDKKS